MANKDSICPKIGRHTVFNGKNLVELISDLSDRHLQIGIEIGVHRGITSQMLLRYLPTLHLYMIDPWVPYCDVERDEQGHEECYNETLLRTDMFSSRRQIVRERSENACSLFPLYYADFVFIDGEHSYEAVLTDLRNYTPKVRYGGYVICHDIKQAPVYRAVKEYCEEREFRLETGRAKSGWFKVEDGKEIIPYNSPFKRIL